MSSRGTRFGRYWVPVEIEQMLQLAAHGKFAKHVMLCRKRSNPAAFRCIAQMLTKNGYSRSMLQVRSKIKILRQAFYKTLLHFGEDPRPAQKSPYFNLLKKIWEKAGCPPAADAFPKEKEVDVASDVGSVSESESTHLDRTASQGEKPHSDFATRAEIESVLSVQQDLATRIAAIEELLDMDASVSK